MSILVTSKRLTAKGLQFDLALLLKPMEPVRFKTSDVAKERLIDGQDTNKVLLLYTGGTIGMHRTR